MLQIIETVRALMLRCSMMLMPCHRICTFTHEDLFMPNAVCWCLSDTVDSPPPSYHIDKGNAIVTRLEIVPTLLERPVR